MGGVGAGRQFNEESGVLHDGSLGILRQVWAKTVTGQMDFKNACAVGFHFLLFEE